MMNKKYLSFLILVGLLDFIYATDVGMKLFPIKKRVPGNTVKYEVAFIDYNGKLIIPFEYSWGSTFENGIAAVKKNDQSFLIDTKNLIVKEIPKKYYLFNGFSEGLCIIQDKETELYGYINYKGEIEIPIEYTHAEDFTNNIAKVYKGNKSFYINKKNEIVNPIEEKEQQEFYIFTDEKKHLKGLKNINDEIIIPAKYADLWMPTAYGLCVFSSRDDSLSYGVVNIKNEIIFPDGSFFEIHDFKNGMAIFSPRNNNGGYLREDGKVFQFSDYY